MTIARASGGISEELGFDVSTNNDMILGFSMSGAIIPAGNTLLTTISFSDTSGEICFNNATMGDPIGDPIYFAFGDCVSSTFEPHYISTVSYTHLTLPTNREV